MRDPLRLFLTCVLAMLAGGCDLDAPAAAHLQVLRWVTVAAVLVGSARLRVARLEPDPGAPVPAGVVDEVRDRRVVELTNRKQRFDLLGEDQPLVSAQRLTLKKSLGTGWNFPVAPSDRTREMTLVSGPDKVLARRWW